MVVPEIKHSWLFLLRESSYLQPEAEKKKLFKIIISETTCLFKTREDTIVMVQDHHAPSVGPLQQHQQQQHRQQPLVDHLALLPITRDKRIIHCRHPFVLKYTEARCVEVDLVAACAGRSGAVGSRQLHDQPDRQKAAAAAKATAATAAVPPVWGRLALSLRTMTRLQRIENFCF